MVTEGRLEDPRLSRTARCCTHGFGVNARGWHASSTNYMLKGQLPGVRGAQGSQPAEYAALWKKFLRWELERQLTVTHEAPLLDLSWLLPWQCDEQGVKRLPGSPEEMPVIVWIASGAFPPQHMGRSSQEAAAPPPPPPAQPWGHYWWQGPADAIWHQSHCQWQWWQ